MSGARSPRDGRTSRVVLSGTDCPLQRARHRRYEDNFDAVNNLFVVVKSAEKSKIEARGRLWAVVRKALR